jgi:hypothetical protein
MKMLVSKNRSTQLARQLSSPRENLVEGVPVMHLIGGPQLKSGSLNKDDNALVPAHAGECMNRLLGPRMCLLPLEECLQLLLE